MFCPMFPASIIAYRIRLDREKTIRQSEQHFNHKVLQESPDFPQGIFAMYWLCKDNIGLS